MFMLLKSLARNETTVVGNNTLIKDISEIGDEKEKIESRITIDDYLDVLNRLHIIENQEAYSENYRSPTRVGKSPKRHFTDVSLACSCLDLTKDKLINDLKTFGFMFEAMVERDLRIYMEYLNGKPKFMCVVVGFTDVIAKDPETGIYIVPITALKP